MRAIAESDTESTVSGPRGALTESLQTNLSLVKRWIQNSDLKSKSYNKGIDTNTKIAVLYMETIVNQDNLLSPVGSRPVGRLFYREIV